MVLTYFYISYFFLYLFSRFANLDFVFFYIAFKQIIS